MENISEGGNSLLFDILDVVGTIVGILVELNELQTILNIGEVSKRHNEYLHSKKLWQNLCNRVFYDKSTTRISSNIIRSIFNHTQHETEIPLLLSDLHSNDTTKQFQAVEHLRRLLNYNEDILAFQKSVLLSPLVKLLDADDQPKLQYEVTCLLTTVTTTYRYTPRIFNIGAGAILTRLLKSASLEQQEQSAWTLSNMVFNRETINGLLNEGDINVVINIVKAYKRVETVRACMSLLKNVCRFNNWSDFLPVISLSLDLIMRDTRDMQVCDDACMTLARLKRLGMFEQVQNRPNALQTIVELMSLPGAVALVATISHASAELARAVLDAGFVAQVKILMTANKPAPNRYHLGNLIFAVSCQVPREVEHVRMLIEDGEIYPIILGHANNPTSSDSVKERATWVIINALDSDRSVSTYKYFSSIGALEPLCKGLNMWTDPYMDGEYELDTLLGVLKRMLEWEAQGEVEGVKAQLESWCQTLYERSRSYDIADDILSKYFPTFEPDRSTAEVEDYESAISYKY